MCALLLAAPAAALAREPVISYVDENGVFRLYDEETESEINPPPPVPSPANFLGFRYGMSMSGRYIVYNDDPAPRHLHLLDRATNALVPLPGIDVYANPDNLTVSNNGLIAFDNQGNGPAVVFSSAAGAFVDSGLAADNAHRQTRLSGDGRFLGTTCDSPTNCAAPTLGADAFVQDLTAMSDTAFPADATRDEEHACLNGDGSIFGIDKAASADRSPSTTSSCSTGASRRPRRSRSRARSTRPTRRSSTASFNPTGRYLGFMNAFLTFMLWDRTGGPVRGPSAGQGVRPLLGAVGSVPAAAAAGRGQPAADRGSHQAGREPVPDGAPALPGAAAGHVVQVQPD